MTAVVYFQWIKELYQNPKWTISGKIIDDEVGLALGTGSNGHLERDIAALGGKQKQYIYIYKIQQTF